MPRTRTPGRLNDIVDAGLEVFSTVGYRRARMQDVATAAGVSPGLLYTYAAGKEALFALVVQREAGVDISTLPLPAPNTDTDALTALVRKVMRALLTARELDATEKATRRPTDVRVELAGIIAEQYESQHRARRLLRLVERCALDWPELAELFYGRTRTPYVKRLGRYIARRVESGDFHAVPDPDVAARFIIESVAWFANHRYGDRHGAAIDDVVARTTVVDLLTNAFVAT